jgi:hypothetical protein
MHASDEAILHGLRKALAGPAPLFGSGKTDGLFPAGAKGKALAERAVAAGFVEEVRDAHHGGNGRKKGKEIVRGRLTEKGRQHLLEAESPRRLLEGLAPALDRVAGQLTAARKPLEVPSEKIGAAAEAVVDVIRDGVVSLQRAARQFIADTEELLTKLPQAVRERFGGPAQVGPAAPAEQVAALEGLLAVTSATVRAALERFERQAAPSPVSPTVPHSEPEQALAEAGASSA